MLVLILGMLGLAGAGFAGGGQGGEVVILALLGAGLPSDGADRQGSDEENSIGNKEEEERKVDRQ